MNAWFYGWLRELPGLAESALVLRKVFHDGVLFTATSFSVTGDSGGQFCNQDI